jgi:hypothetical protein
MINIIEFQGCNVTYAKNQPEYRPLPALVMDDGEIITCWGLSFKDRLKILFTGKIWLNVLTFNKPLQPLLMSVDKPEHAVKVAETRPFWV